MERVETMPKRRRKNKNKDDEEQGRKFLLAVGAFLLLFVIGFFVVTSIFGGF